MRAKATHQSFMRRAARAAAAACVVAGMGFATTSFADDPPPPPPPPPPPSPHLVISGTNPASPSSNASPRVYSDPSNPQVSRPVVIYGQANCQGPELATARSPSEFVKDGIPVPVTRNATTTLSADTRASDGGGGQCSNNFNYTHDSIDPSVTISTPVDGAQFTVGEKVAAAYSCSDSGSGITSCTGPVADGADIDTTTGDHTFTIDAEDKAGNKATKTVSYTVAPSDSTAPTITVASPTEGATYARGQKVTASYSCADEVGGSGLKSCDGDVPYGALIDTSTVGSGRAFDVGAEDKAGNTSQKSVTYTVVDDVTAPSITISAPVEGAVYNVGDKVKAGYSCSDSGSGNKSCTGPVADGANIDTSTSGDHTFTVEAEDNAGNKSSKPVSYSVKFDLAGPTISVSRPLEGATYRRGQKVVASYSCADEAGGSGLKSCGGDVANGARIDTASVGRKGFEVDAEDNYGNSSLKFVRYTVVDVVAPRINLSGPVDGGRYDLGRVVTASYSCADETGGSGVKSCSGTVANRARIDTSSVGTKTFTVEAEDNAGNKATKTVSYTVEDVTAPQIKLSGPVNGGRYALRQAVTASYSCSDETGGSGLKSCVGTVANRARIDTSSLGAKTFTVEAEDNAGNKSTKTISYTVVDVTAPRISLSRPTEGASYTLGQVVTASYRCTDETGGSGMKSCAGTVASGARIDTATAGTKTFTVEAQDNAGNKTTKTVSYTVTDSSPGP